MSEESDRLTIEKFTFHRGNETHVVRITEKPKQNRENIMSDRYTAEAFLRAIGRHENDDYLWASVRDMFTNKGGIGQDSLALGLGLEWLRAQQIGKSTNCAAGLYMRLWRTIAEMRDTPPLGQFKPAFEWLLFDCPRPGAALAKAIIDATEEKP